MKVPGALALLAVYFLPELHPGKMGLPQVAWQKEGDKHSRSELLIVNTWGNLVKDAIIANILIK